MAQSPHHVTASTDCVPSHDLNEVAGSPRGYPIVQSIPRLIGLAGRRKGDSIPGSAFMFLPHTVWTTFQNLITPSPSDRRLPNLRHRSPFAETPVPVGPTKVDRSVNVFDASSCVGVILGAACGCWLGYSWLGWVGAALGIPIGALAGAFILPLVVYAAWLVGLWREAGLAGIREELWPNRDTGHGQADRPPEHGAT